MAYVALVTVIALLQFFWFGWRVGRARTKYGVPAPATSGHEVFERYFRVQMNTLEQLVIFIPSAWIFAHFVSPTTAAGLGVVFIVGRAIYAETYIRNPKRRALGFALTAFANLGLMIGVVTWAVQVAFAELRAS